ncbi:ATP-binding protein [Jatrophihabitans telluris]|uniref:ATP-binding protein n=1 Tax=Jatrophihabitans telluris TaxID=2038343 RepID=UPI003D313A8C
MAAHAAAGCGLLSYRMPISALPTDAAELDALARLWQRESMLLPVALYLDAEDSDAEDPNRAGTIRAFLQRVQAPVLVAVRESWPELATGSVTIAVAPPTVSERAEAWRAALPADTDDARIEALAVQFPMDATVVHELAADAGADVTRVWARCRERSRPRLDSLAKRLDPTVSWSDLVLPAPQLAQLHELADQVSNRKTVYEDWGFGRRSSRGLGVTALFSGAAGVGKTLGAEVLAQQLQLDLYRIDLSAVVSKYIGETEKNLRRLFDAAEGGGVILFFDEADALFGKRSDVKDAHDRYANTQTNYLLQRMEDYGGLCILATNLRRSLDAAFVRRIRFIVEFPFPEQAERRAIWATMLPPQTPHDELDLDRLAELRLTGGMARNIAVNAAFLAAAEHTGISMPTLMAAARSEFRKLEVPLRESDFQLEGK